MILIGGVILLVVVIVMMCDKKTRNRKPIPQKNNISSISDSKPIPKKNYISSISGDYLILNNGSEISSTKDYTKATPISLGPFTYFGLNFNVIKTEDGKFISTDGTAITYTNTLQQGQNIFSLYLTGLPASYPTAIALAGYFGPNAVLQPSLQYGSFTSDVWSVVFV